jgi:hypothetical protein
MADHGPKHAYAFMAGSDGLAVSRMTRETMISRVMDAVPRAPHLADLPAALVAGLGFAIIPAGKPFPFVRHDEGRPILFVVGDDLLLANGPDAFHRKTLRRMLDRAVFVGILPGAPERAFYGRAIRAALDAKGWAVLVETQEGQRVPWLRFLAKHAKVTVEINSTVPRAA